jgi:hypothetical protein
VIERPQPSDENYEQHGSEKEAKMANLKLHVWGYAFVTFWRSTDTTAGASLLQPGRLI